MQIIKDIENTQSKVFYQTKLGILEIRCDKTHIKCIDFAFDTNIENLQKYPLINSNKVCSLAILQIEEFLAKKRKKFDLPLAPEGTEFQKKVWSELQKIPYGETRSYKDIAIAIGNPKAVRAVGMANNKNPIVIVIPCHRVIGTNGTLVGYAGGLDLKRQLLDLENASYKK